MGSFQNYWIGGTSEPLKINSGSITDWRWTKSNSLMTFFDWNPLSSINETCVIVQSDSKWSSFDCKTTSPFVCEVPATLNYCENGWAYYDETNSCYKKFSTPAGINRTFANAACIQKNAQLVSIHSDVENTFITDLTTIGLNTSYLASTFWIGAMRLDNGNNWFWSDNTTFDYTNWAPNGVSNQYCASLSPDYSINSPGQWNDRNCGSVLYSYLCKKSPITMIL